MATFNFSTMQMTVKVVYYGPGLCGKTTNLQFIYNHTAPKSRGEMVSLETKSDRTLFFDLLPLEVGTIAGFKTKIQLYTVPGQVFYNTTRKLVLKGVDGIVFVADSQRPMLSSNVESLGNLETNLAELGIVMDTVPLVLQYNKRDLSDVCGTDELDEALNARRAPSIEASALTGTGVFETLRAVSRQTLGALKKQLEEGPLTAARPQEIAAQAEAARVAAPTSTLRAKPIAPPASIAEPSRSIRKAPVPTLAPAAAPQRVPAAAAAAAPAVPRPKPRPVRPPAPSLATPGMPKDGNSKISRSLSLHLKQPDLERTQRLSFILRLEDGNQQLVHEIRDVLLDLQDSKNHKNTLLQLNIRLNPDG